MSEEDDVRTQCVRELHTHVAESPQADDAHFLALTDAPVSHGRVCGDPGAQEGRGPGEIKV